MSDCPRDALEERDEPYLKGVIGRISSASDTHISYPVYLHEWGTTLTFRFETEQTPRGGPAHKAFLEETNGPPTHVVSGDAAVVPLDSRLGRHALTDDTTGQWGILPVSHAEDLAKSFPRRIVAAKLRDLRSPSYSETPKGSPYSRRD